MHAGRVYSPTEVLRWTFRETLVFFALAAVPVTLYATLGWTWLRLPWLPIALVGTAVAFITGFKNSASYSRLWEARQIWGAIVNDSRKWGILVRELVREPETRRRLIYRHLAWLTALGYELRQPRTWENMGLRENVEYGRKYNIPEWVGDQEAELRALLEADEASYVLGKKNPAKHLIGNQARELREWAGGLEPADLRWVTAFRLLGDFADSQGKRERIKNFPYPRQYATLNLFFVWLFILLAPYGLLEEFRKLGDSFVWLTIPAGAIVSWVLHTMEKIGSSSENPFEGGRTTCPSPRSAAR
jgi:putative membrane protein